MHNEKGSLQGTNLLIQIGTPNVLDEMPSQGQCFPSNQEGRFAVVENSVDQRIVVPLDVRGIVGRTDTRDRLYLGDILGGCDNRRTAKGVADQEADRTAAALHEPNSLRRV